MDQNLALDVILTITPENFVAERILNNILNALLLGVHDQLQECFTADKPAGAIRQLIQLEVEIFSRIPEEHLRAILDFLKSEPGQKFILASREVAKKQLEWTKSIASALDIVTAITPENLVAELIQSKILRVTQATLPDMHEQLRACFITDKLAGVARQLIQFEREVFSCTPEEHLQAILDFLKSEPGQKFILASREVVNKQLEWAKSVTPALIN